MSDLDLSAKKPLLPEDEEYEEAQRTREYLSQLAESYGCEAVFGEPNIIQLDLDSEEAVTRYRAAYAIVERTSTLPPHRVEEWTSRSGKGLHVQLILDIPIPPERRVIWQALLGSDPVRETLNYLNDRATKNDGTIVLFRPLSPPPGATVCPQS